MGLRTWKRIAIAAAGVIVLILAALFLAHTAPVRRYILKQLESALHAEALDYNLFAGTARLKGVRVPGNPNLASADEIAVVFSPWSLLSGKPRVAEVRIPNLTLHYFKDPGGRDNLPPAKPDGAESDPDAFHIDRLSVGASVRYDDRAAGALADLNACKVEARDVTPVNIAELRLTCGPSSVRYQDRNLALDSLALNGSRARDDFRIAAFDLRSGASTVSVSGTVGSGSRADLTVRAHVESHPLVPVEGTADATVRLTGTLPQPAIEIAQATIQSPYGRLEAQAAVSLEERNPTKGRATFSQVDVTRLAREFKAPVPIGARASGDATFEFPGLAYERGTAHANVSLTPVAVGTPVEGQFTLDAANGSYRLTARNARAMGVQLDGAIQAARDGALSGTAALLVPDLNKTPAAIAGTGKADLTFGGTIGNPSASAAATVEHSGLTLRAQVEASKTAAEVRHAELTYKDRVVATASGQLNPLRIDARADQVPLPLLLEMAGLVYPVEGSLSGTFQAAADSGTGRLSIAGLRAYEEMMGEFTADVALQGKTVRVSNAVLIKPAGGELRADGSYNLDDTSFRFSSKGTGLLVEALRLPSGIAHAKASFTAEGEGSRSARQVDATFDVTEARWNDTIIGTAQGKATLLNDGVNASLGLPDFGATTQLRVSLDPPYAAGIEAQLVNTVLRDLPVEATVTASLSATGNLQNWQDGEAKGEITAVRLKRGEAAAASNTPAPFSLARRTLSLQPFTLLSGSSSITLSGTAPVAAGAPPADVRLQANLTAADAKTFLAAFGTEAPPEVEGAAALDLALRGEWKKFVPQGELTIRDGAYRDLRGVTATFTVTPQSIGMPTLSATWHQAPIEGKGVVPLSLIAPEGWLATEPATAPGRVQVSWKNLDLATVLREQNEKLGGTSGGEADIEIRGLNLRGIGGTLTLNPLDLRMGEIGFALEQPARLTLRQGVAHLDQFNLKGTAGNLSLKGDAGLTAPQPLRIEASGKLDAAIAAALSDQFTAGGEARFQALVSGTATAPILAGYFETDDLDATLPAFNVQAESIRSRIDFKGDAVTIAALEGTVNGGVLRGTGGLRLVKGAPENVHLNLTLANVFLEYPRDLKTALNAALALRSDGSQYALNGDVQVLEGSYNENINFDEFVIRGLTTETPTAGAAEASTFPRRLRLNVGLRTVSPILVNNNLGKAAIQTDLKVLGTAAQPGLSGRLTLEEGSELQLNERTYLVERGTVTFVDDRRIRPTLDILAHTQVGGEEITLQVQGEQGALESKFTSDQGRSEPDILALLVTGRTLDDLAGNEADFTKEQVLSYLTTRVGGALTRRVERTFGISQVRIQPNLIAAESDPGARLTVGQDITRQLRLTYSMDLASTNNQLWLGEYDLTRRFRLRGFKDFDNTYRFEFRHEMQFGAADLGIASQPRAPLRKIGKVNFEGNFYLTEKELADRAKLKTGRDHDFFAVRKAAERIETRYRSKAFHEARVRTERDVQESVVNLLFRIREGSEVDFVYEGWHPPSSVRKNVVRIWQRGVFDTGRAVAATAELRRALIGEGYLQPTVTQQIRQTDERHKRVVFEIHPGAKFENPLVAVEGAKQLSESRIRRAVNRHRPKTDVYLRPQRVAESLTALYRAEGYLEAEVSAPRLTADAQARTAELRLTVNEGPRFTIAAPRFAGISALSEEELRKALELEDGEVYRQSRVDEAIEDLQLRYASEGYNEAEIEAAAKRSAGVVELEFRVTEGRQSRLEEVTVTGNRRTSTRLIRTQARLRAGQVLNPQRISDARRNLYSTGAYSLVEIETKEVPGPDNEKRLSATINVRELTPFVLRYGGFYDTERGLGGIADFVTRNYLGSARQAGVRTRYDSQLQEVRGYFSQPLLRRFPVATTSAVFFRREIRPAFIADRTGVSVVQETRFKRRYILNWGYKLEKTHTYDRNPDEDFPFDISLRVAPLQLSLTRDYRDDILDATRGSFLSQSLEYAPKVLGSELRFARYYGQYFHYLPLTKPSEIPWSNGARRPRVIYAGALRVGLAKGLDGQSLVSSERFFAGGGNSIRGFQQDFAGPLDALGNPLGGNALFVTNHEMRFPVASIVEGVAFVDSGNVFRTVSEWRPWDLRTSVGLGARLRTPYFLFRLDYGVITGRRPGESFGRFFFSIGQSF